jgi:hypothetical protein
MQAAAGAEGWKAYLASRASFTSRLHVALSPTCVLRSRGGKIHKGRRAESTLH